MKNSENFVWPMGPHLKGTVVLWAHSPPNGQQLHYKVTTRPESLSEFKLPSWRSGQLSTFPCHKALRPLRANSLLVFPRAGHSLNGDATRWGTSTWLTFSFSWYFFHWLKQQLLFGGPCLLTMTQTVSELWSSHLRIGQCDITSLESDFCCPDCPCDSKTGPGIEEVFFNM